MTFALKNILTGFNFWRLHMRRALSGCVLFLALWVFMTPAIAAFNDGEPSLSGNYLAGLFATRIRDDQNAVLFYTQTLKEDPDNKIVQQRTMLHLIAIGDLKTALKFARNIATYKPNHRSARLILALNDFRAGRYSAARRHLKRANEVPLAKLTSAVIMAWSHVAERRPKKALSVLKAIKDVRSLKSFYNFHRALIADVGGLKNIVEKAYKKSYKENPRSVRNVQAFGRYLERQNRQAEALKLYESFLKINPTHALVLSAANRARSGNRPSPLVVNARGGVAELLFGVASILSDDAGIDISLRFTRMAIHMRPKFVLSQVLLGDVYGGTKRYKLAIKAYESVPMGSPLKRNSDIQTAVNLDRLEKTDQAQALLEKIIKRYPKDFEPLLIMADMLRAHDKFKPAADYYSKAIAAIDKFERRHWSVFYHRGISYERSKNWPEAEKDFKQALALYPKQAAVLNYLGYSWVEKRLNLKQAMAMIRNAVKQRSGDGYIVDSLGWAHYQLGEYQEAVKILERAVGLRPDDPVINDHLGDAYWHVGRKLEAKFQWSHARDLKPEAKALKIILLKLKAGLKTNDPKRPKTD